MMDPVYSASMPLAMENLPVIEEWPELLQVGSIEVENVERAGGQIIHRIVCLPPTEASEVEVEVHIEGVDIVDRQGKEEEEEEAEDEEPGVFENLTNAFINTCTGGYDPCTCQPYKPALRKSMLRTQRGYHVPFPSERTVSFSSLEIREFNMTLGDHPSARSGPPVALDWNSKASEHVVDVDEYERARSPRRSRRQLKLSYDDRMTMLEKERGFTEEEVNEAWLEALKIRQQRKETLNRGLLLMAIDDVMESIQRKYSKLSETIAIT